MPEGIMAERHEKKAKYSEPEFAAVENLRFPTALVVKTEDFGVSSKICSKSEARRASDEVS